MAIGMGEVPSKPKTDKLLFSLVGQEQCSHLALSSL